MTGEGQLWIEILLVVTGIIGAFLFFVLRGIRDNQTRIWEWAREETHIIEDKIDKRDQRTDQEMADLRRWVRHENRNVYCTLIELTKLLGEHGKEIEGDIHKRLEQIADE